MAEAAWPPKIDNSDCSRSDQTRASPAAIMSTPTGWLLTTIGTIMPLCIGSASSSQAFRLPSPKPLTTSGFGSCISSKIYGLVLKGVESTCSPQRVRPAK